jgi:GNAT superfamily N-acetyltransferase
MGQMMEIDLFNPIDDSDQNNFFVTQPAIMLQGFSKAATKRILSSPITMRENISNSGARRLVKELQKYLKAGIKPTILTTISNELELRYFEIFHTYHFYLVTKEEKIIGFLSAKFNRFTFRVKISWIDPAYRGKNLGIELYLAAIKILGALSSSTNIGIMALKTWNKLAKYCKVSLYNEKDQKVNYKLDSRGIPVVNGIPIDEQKGDFYFVGTK